MRTVLYILVGALCLWLFCSLWFNLSKGLAGEEVSSYLFQLLGQGAGLIPLFLSYWLLQTIRNKSTSFLPIRSLAAAA